MQINYNGQLVPENEAVILSGNGALRFGYGLFESMLVTNGKINLGKQHWERLVNGMAALGFMIPGAFTQFFLEEQVLKTTVANKCAALSRARLQVHPVDYRLGMSRLEPEFLIEAWPLDPGTLELNATGWVAGLAQGVPKAVTHFSRYKTCNALGYALAAVQAQTNQWDDALISNTDGNIIESSIGNIFWVAGNHLYTPPLSEGCVAGVMRRYIVDNTNASEQPLTAALLMEADELFISNAVRRIRWIGRLGERQYASNCTTALFRDLFG